MNDLKPYERYVDSDVAWVGTIPAHWSRFRLKNLSAIPITNGVGEAAWPYRSDWPRYVRTTDIKDRITLKEETRASLPPELAEKAMLEVGDVLFSAAGTIGKSYWHSRDTGPTCYAGFLVRLRPIAGVSQAFLSYWTESSLFQDQVVSGAVESTIQNFSASKYRALHIALPPTDEQLAIVRFLDYVDRRVRRAITAKQRLIALLAEQIQLDVHQAVTRGLNPSVPFKDSGTDWLGSVPEHWQLKRAKYFFSEVDERSTTGSEELLSVSHITGVTPRSEKTITMFMASSYVGHKLCRPGDLVINTMWAWMAALGVADRVGIVSPSYGVYRPLKGSELLGDYADLLLRTKPYTTEYVCRSTGIRSSRLRLYPEQFLRIVIACPPPDEQRAILEWVRTQSREADNAILSARREVALLREYRQRLITDAVQGRIDLQGVAARLPTEEVESAELESLGEEDADEFMESIDGLEDVGEEALV